ncbi:hypothetical protein SNEBB_004203 [Seison nebaliae]|nr:hypothetical protein SNEBB_004203 [Seison nebaliae]
MIQKTINHLSRLGLSYQLYENNSNYFNNETKLHNDIIYGYHTLFNRTAMEELIERNGRLFDLIISGYLTSIIAIFGILGNIFTLYVLMQRQLRRTSTNIYLMALSMSNIFQLSFFFLHSFKEILVGRNYYYTLIEHTPSTLTFLHFNTQLYCILRAPTLSCQLLSILLTMAFSVDRYIYVCHPFKADRFCTVRRAKIVSILLFLASLLYFSPCYFEFRVGIHSQPIWTNAIQLTETVSNEIFQSLFQSDEHQFIQQLLQNNITEMMNLNIDDFYHNYYKKNLILVQNISVIQNFWFARQRLVHSLLFSYLYLPIAYGIPWLTLIYINFQLIRTLIQLNERKKRIVGKNDQKRTLLSMEQKSSIIPNGKYNSKMEGCLDTMKDDDDLNCTSSPINHFKKRQSLKRFTSNLLDKTAKKSFAMRKDSQSQTEVKSIVLKSDIRMTVMLISVVIYFMICQFPTLVANMITVLTTPNINGQAMNIFYTIACFLLNLNASTNFILYCCFGKNFRNCIYRIYSDLQEKLKNCIPYQFVTKKTTSSTPQSIS